MLLIWCCKNAGTSQKYNFEAAIARHQERAQNDEQPQGVGVGVAAAAKPLPRCMSTPAFSLGGHAPHSQPARAA